MNVLSLFDGMSCGQQALERAGIKVDKYFASEIDKYAIQVTMANYPNTIQLGSVTEVNGKDLPKIDLLIGGSPCQSFSFAGRRKGMSTKDNQDILTLKHYLQLKEEGFEFEGQSYLFWEYMRLLHEVKPKYFLLENVMMAQKWKDILTGAIGIDPIMINSSLLSAQNRKRLYWTNIGAVNNGLFGELKCGIPQPEDKGILLRDVLEDDVDPKYCLSGKMVSWLEKHALKRDVKVKRLDGNQKSSCLTATAQVKQNLTTDYIVHNLQRRNSDRPSLLKDKNAGGSGHLQREDGKTYCLDTANTQAVEILGCDFRTDEGFRIRENGKSGTLAARARNDESCGQLAKINSNIRRLTPIECERLQTVKYNEIIFIFTICLDQAKNYVNAVSQNHRLLKLALNAEEGELKDSVEFVIQNMKQSNLQTKSIVHQNADMQIRNQTSQITNLSQQESNIIVNNAELCAMSNCHKGGVDFVHPNAFIDIIEGKTIHCGKEESHLKDKIFTKQLNGSKPLLMCGEEIMQLVKDVNVGIKRKSDTNSTSTILSVLSTESIDQMLIIYYLFAKNVTIGYTQNIINQNNLSIQFKIKDGYTNHVSDSQRYKMLGNGWTVDVIAYIFGYLNK